MGDVHADPSPAFCSPLPPEGIQRFPCPAGLGYFFLQAFTDAFINNSRACDKRLIAKTACGYSFSALA